MQEDYHVANTEHEKKSTEMVGFASIHFIWRGTRRRKRHRILKEEQPFMNIMEISDITAVWKWNTLIADEYVGIDYVIYDMSRYFVVIGGGTTSNESDDDYSGALCKLIWKWNLGRRK